MAGPYPGYGPQAASVAATPKSWFERLVEALSSPGGEWRDPESGQTFPAGGRLGAVAAELTGLAGASRTVANLRAGHPLTDPTAPSYAGQYGDVLDTIGLAAPAVALGTRGLAKVAGAVADDFVANSGPRARQRGAIRAGGWESLIPSHATDLEGLESARDSLGPNMLYSPSIGINLNKVNRFKDQTEPGTIFLIPKIGAFDPATSASVLYNRDAYLPRHGSYALNQWGGGKTGENLAFDKGLANLRLIGGEGKSIPKHNPESIQMTWSNTAGHKAALANSPHFKSFAQYESSPAGAATLVEGPKSQVIAGVEPLYNGYRDEMQNLARWVGIPFKLPTDQARFSAIYRSLLYGNRAERNSILASVEQLHGPEVAQELSKVAAKYRQKFSRAPAEYAELQPQGLTPLTEENWAGAMVAGKGASTTARGLLKNLPIEWFEPGSLTADDMKRFQGEYGLARRQPIGQRLQLSAADRDPPKTPAPYLTGLAGAYNPAQKGAQKAQEAAQAGPFAWLPDAFAFSGMKVPDDIPEELAIPLWNEKEAAEHLKFIGTQWPLVTNPAAKKNYEVALVGVIQLMDKKGWKPLPETYQVIAGLDEVFPPMVGVKKQLKETDLSPTGIPWKNIAGGFKDHEADVIGGGTTQGEDIANFIELLKEAGLDVAKGLNASGDKGVQISAADDSAAVFIPSSSWSPQKYKDIIHQFLPKVWAHMQANP